MFDGGNPLIALLREEMEGAVLNQLFHLPATSRVSLHRPQVLYKVDGFKNVQSPPSWLPFLPLTVAWSISWPCPAAPAAQCMFLLYELPLFLV